MVARESSGGGSEGAGVSTVESGSAGRSWSAGGSFGAAAVDGFVSAAWCVIKPG